MTFKFKLYITLITSKLSVTHAEYLQTMCRQNIQQWLTKYICLREVGKTPFATNQNDYLSWRCIFYNLQSKSPWQSFSGFPFSLHKIGMWRTCCRYVGFERLQRGSTNRNCFATGPDGGGPGHNDVKSAQECWIYTTVLYTPFCAVPKKKSIVSKHNTWWMHPKMHI